MTQPTTRAPLASRELLGRPFHEWSRSDIGLVRKAIRGHWPIHKEDRARIVAVLVQIATHPERCGARTSVAAAKVLLEAGATSLPEHLRPAPKGAGGAARRQG